MRDYGRRKCMGRRRLMEEDGKKKKMDEEEDKGKNENFQLNLRY